MKSNNKVFLAVTCLALAALSCQAVTNLTGGGDIPGAPTSAPVDTDVPDVPNGTEAPATEAPQQGDVLLQDDFSSSKWGTGTDKDSSIEYANEALQVILFTKNYFVWSTPNDQDYQNIHAEVTVTNNNTDPTTAFGIICHQQVTTNDFYYFAITPAGQYAIAKAVTGQKDVFLTNNNEWQYSDLVKANAPSYRIGADCGTGALTLYVDGQKVDSVSDSTYTTGGVALFTWSGEDVASANVTFDDFLLTKLP
ncbi:MAG TPA: hypothetical protein VF896_17370 [Anaerolineales bacterium]